LSVVGIPPTITEGIQLTRKIIPSGGWLAEIVPAISDVLGIWDIFILSGVFIISWVVLRVTDSLTSMILGFTFDVTIPLQHHSGPST
jgi:hypothetical protein